MADGTTTILAAQAIAERAADIIVTGAQARTAVVRLERELDGWVQDHLDDMRDRWSLAIGEADVEFRLLDQMAAGLAMVAGAAAKLSATGISSDGPKQSAEAIADLITEGDLDGFLRPSAARVLSASIAVKLAEVQARVAANQAGGV